MPRTHKQQIEAAKRDAYRTQYKHVNGIDFLAAWKAIADLDPGLSKEAPENLPEDARRALVGLARRVAELEHEWS